MLPTEWQMWFVLGVVILLVLGLIIDKVRPYKLFISSSFLLMLSGVLTPKTFLNSFANESIATIFILIFITAGININFNILKYLDSFFTQKRRPKFFILQMTVVVSLLSSVMNNTPIVAMLIPYVLRWSKKTQISPSKLLIPLSYAAITGGMITIIGTSTNLVLNGFIQTKGGEPFAFFDFAIPGLLVTAVCILFLSVIGYYFLEERRNPMDVIKDNLKEYLVEVSLSPNATQRGKTVNEAGLRNLQGIYLVEILRGEKIISPVSPNEVLLKGDRLFFAGDTTDILEIVKEDSGFQFPKTEQFNLQGQLEIVEALIPYNSNLSGKTLKETGFREMYDAAVIAIHRNSERLSGKLGDIKLSHGDLLMLTAGNKFNKAVSNDTNLYKLEIKDQLGRVPSWKAYILFVVSIFSIVGIITSILPFFVGVLIILTTFFGLRLMTQKDILKNLNLDLLLILGSAIAIGSSFIESGAAKFVAENIIGVFLSYGNLSLIIGIYLLTLLLTSFITNVAAVSIVFPIAFEVSNALHVPVEALYLAIAFGASCSFITPFGYQTNLMVYGVGGYKFKDFLRIGTPMTILYSLVCLAYILIQFNII